MKNLVCLSCSNNLVKVELQNQLDLMFYKCNKCNYELAFSHILIESIHNGNKNIETQLSILINKNSSNTVFTTNDSFENQRQPPSN